MGAPTESETKFSENVKKAEVYHVVKTVVNNSSFSDVESSKVKLSSLQFPDSTIAKSMSIGHTKSIYTLNAVTEGVLNIFKK